MTLDGYCDHTAVIPDDSLLNHFTALLKSADLILYGRVTYLLMETSWPEILKDPSADKADREFAEAIDQIPKIVFSRTLTSLHWDSAQLARRPLEEVVKSLKEEDGKTILVGSPGLISALTQLRLIDEYQLCVHPVIAGCGLPLFKDIRERNLFKFVRSHNLDSGAINLYYERIEK